MAVIWVGSQMLSPSLFDKLISLSITSPKNKAAAGKLILLDKDLTLFDSTIFKKNRRLTFMMGWKHELVTTGPYIIKNVAPAFPETGEVTLIIDFQDKSHKANKKQRKKKWLGKPQDILRKIAESQKLGFDIDPIEGVEFTEDFPLIQANMTDAALIQRLSWRYGYIWGVYGNNLVFKKASDLELSGIQSPREIPVLHYRQGDCSIRSFLPEMKFSKGGRKKNTTKKTANIDFLLKDGVEDIAKNMESMDLESFAKSMADTVGTFDIEEVAKGMGSIIGGTDKSSGIVDSLFGGNPFAIESGQVLDVDTETGNTNSEKELKKIVDNLDNVYDPETGKWSKRKEDQRTKAFEEDDATLDSDIGDESGAATPADKEEANRRNASKIIKTSSTIEGKLEPTVASMYYRPRKVINTAGLGKILSGKYEIQEVVQTISGTDTTFETSLTVMKRKFYPSKESKSQIAATTMEDEDGRSSADEPTITKNYDADTGTWLQKIDGMSVEEYDRSQRTKKTATVIE